MRPEFALGYHAQQLRLLWVVATGEQGLRARTAQGEALQLKPSQVLLRWRGAEQPGPAPGAPPLEGSPPPELAAREPWLRERAAGLPLAALQRALPPGEDLPLASIVEALRRVDAGALPALAEGVAPGAAMPLPDSLGAAAPAPAGEAGWAWAALCWALAHERERFRRGERGFAALSPDEQAALAQRQQARQSRAGWQAQAQAWARELAQGRWQAGGLPLGERFLAALLSLAAHERESPHWAELAKPLELQHLRGSVALHVLPWLRAAGAWPGWPSLWLERARVQRGYDPAVLEQARALAAAPVASAGRKDWQAVPTYTLDAASTVDYDDALSILEADGPGLVVAVHITEPSSLLMPGQALFEAAAQRQSSVYTLAGIFPLYPPALALGRFSLIKGRPREAVTLRLRLRPGQAEWLGVERSVIRVTENLDYARGAELLAEQPLWARLAALCEDLSLARVAQGALLLPRREVHLDCSDPAHIRLRSWEREGPVQRVVEELAIATNQAAGRYCQQHGLPALYRAQSSPDELRGHGGHPPPAHYTLQGRRHHGLACERYVQVTAPGRRFVDLLMQRQIAEHASSGRVALGREAPWQAWMARAEERMGAYDQAERAIQAHGVREYLAQNPGLELPARVRRPGPPAHVWLETLELPALAEAARALPAGSRLTVRLQRVDVDAQQVWVQPA